MKHTADISAACYEYNNLWLDSSNLSRQRSGSFSCKIPFDNCQLIFLAAYNVFFSIFPPPISILAKIMVDTKVSTIIFALHSNVGSCALAECPEKYLFAFPITGMRGRRFCEGMALPEPAIILQGNGIGERVGTCFSDERKWKDHGLYISPKLRPKGHGDFFRGDG